METTVPYLSAPTISSVPMTVQVTENAIFSRECVSAKRASFKKIVLLTLKLQLCAQMAAPSRETAISRMDFAHVSQDLPELTARKLQKIVPVIVLVLTDLVLSIDASVCSLLLELIAPSLLVIHLS